MELYVLIKKHTDERMSQVIAAVKTVWHWTLKNTLYPSASIGEFDGWHNPLDYTRQSVAYDADGAWVEGTVAGDAVTTFDGTTWEAL